MKYTCPLCKQTVSASLYQKITGIWEEKRKALSRIREQRARLLLKIEGMKKALRREATKFRKQKVQLIQQAVTRRTRRLEVQIRTLRRREKQETAQTREKIQRATTRAHKREREIADRQINSLKEQMRTSTRKLLREERERITQGVDTKYKRLKNSFTNTLGQMKIKENELRVQRSQIRELERQLKRQTTPQLEGLLYEHELARQLKKRFPQDDIQHKGKGGDVIHTVMQSGQLAGLIVYECKRVKHFLPNYVKQAAEARKKRRADFAILVTNVMKKLTHGFFVERGVLVVHPAGVLHLVSVLREQTVRIAEMKLGQSQRNKAVKLTLEYLEGPEFSNSLDAIMQETITAYDELKDEMKKHVDWWKKRVASYEKIYEEASTVKSTTKALMSGEREYKKLIQTETLPQLPELLSLDGSISPQTQTENAGHIQNRVDGESGAIRYRYRIKRPA